MMIYLALQNTEKEFVWEDDFYTLSADFNEAIVSFDNHLAELVPLVLNHWNIEGEYQIIMAMTDLKNNFRKSISEEYKANRKSKRRPLMFLPMREWVMDNFNTLMIDNLEADDCIGISADKNSIMLSGDKDFRSIPCRFYDFLRNEFYDTTKEEAFYFHMYQTLIGDTADNYKGCPKIGEVRAKRILDEECSWEAVVRAYKANGSTEEEALVNARLAFILQKGYYNKKTKEVKLWTP
ncbi:MAG: hypothetical protein HUJ83_05745 [Veillonella sp.]|nr:hypothetical protein [Veillonella sp.]